MGLIADDYLMCLTWLCGSTQCVGKAVHLPHNLFPGFVHLQEHLGLSRELPLDVWGAEDALQIKPVPLTCQPLVLRTQGANQRLIVSKSQDRTVKGLAVSVQTREWP